MCPNRELRLPNAGIYNLLTLLVFCHLGPYANSFFMPKYVFVFFSHLGDSGAGLDGLLGPHVVSKGILHVDKPSVSALGHAVDGLKVLVRKRGHLEVALDTARGRALGQHSVATSQAPSKQNMRQIMAAALGDLVEGLVSAHLLAGVGYLVLRSKGRVRLGQDVVLQAKLDEGFVGEERVDFDLVDSGLDLGEGHELLEAVNRPVGHADGARLAGLVELLHGAPCGLGVLSEVLLDDVFAVGTELGLVVVCPLGGNGPVHQEQVDVVSAQGFQGLLERVFHILRLVHVVPGLGADEEVLACELAWILLDEVADGLANLGLVLVEGGAVEMSVADLECLLYSSVALTLGAFAGKGTEADAWHLDAVVQGEGVLRHFDDWFRVCMCVRDRKCILLESGECKS